ncbi:hypothetical protein [Mycobacterium sp. E2462]|uniref:hypothetical protein n=1 Tax=Mycobacterium sp. E2462 TaxID=1834133 RepID=UPI0009EF0755|nr:hypothetical protein [Mycobacterium sp. E2462]
MRSNITDLWYKTNGEPKARCGIGNRWRARYFDDNDKERTNGFGKKAEAKVFLAEISASMMTGTWTAPEAGRVTVAAIYA